ncbi:MAG: beta-N-acetylhexosaminidase [Pseudomonadota bacterium]
MTRPRAVVVGLGGPELSDAERHLLQDGQPLGAILFARNVVDREQLRRLTGAVRDALGRDDAPVLVDQEGGRVARLRPPVWRRYPPARAIADVASADPDVDLATALARDVAERIALDLVEVGIDVVCAPVLDLGLPAADRIIGDRAFGAAPERVAALGRAAIEGALAGGCIPVVKHVPGHGRADVDSHVALPVVTASAALLRATDWLPFRALADAPALMIAHVVYTSFDPERPASCSSVIVDDVVRGELGMTGLLFSDDVDMGALSGTAGERVAAVLAAGCDVALQCNGRLGDIEAGIAAAPPLTDAAWERYEDARAAARTPQQLAARMAALDVALAPLET